MGFDLYGRGPFSTNEPKYPKSDNFEKKEKYFEENAKNLKKLILDVIFVIMFGGGDPFGNLSAI